MRRLAAGGAAVALLLAGCGTTADPGSSPRGDDRLDAERMYAVAADEDATAAEVVDAGRAVEAARSGDTVLVTYTVHNDDDEGRSAAAWRLYDANGGTVAEELAGTTEEGFAYARVDAVPDGYLVQDQDGPRWFVGTDGERTRVRPAPAGPAAPGDVPLDDGSTRVYRPASNAVLAVTPRPTGNWQGWALTSDGTVWMQQPGRERPRAVPFRRSTGGAPWSDVAAYPLEGRRQYVASLALTAVGDHVVAPVVTESDDLEGGRLDALVVRGADDAADAPWTVLDPGDVPGDVWWDTRAFALDDTRVVLTAGDGPVLVHDVTDPGAPRAEVTPPTDEDWSYDAADGRIVATQAAHADAWVSDDLGGSWERLPH